MMLSRQVNFEFARLKRTVAALALKGTPVSVECAPTDQGGQPFFVIRGSQRLEWTATGDKNEMKECVTRCESGALTSRFMRICDEVLNGS